MTDKIGDLVEDKEKARKLEELIEKKVDKKISRVQDREDKNQSPPRIKNDSISRRKFLKSMSIGVAGLGALSLLPSVSAFNIRSSDGLEVWSSGNENFEVKNGDVSVLGGAALDLNSNNIINVNQLNGGSVVIGDKEYKIQKNGTDGQGIINFKTQ